MTLINILAALSSFLLLLFSIHLLFAKSGNRFLNYLLAFFFISRLVENLFFILIFSEQLFYFPYLLTLFSPLSFIAPALFYLYVDGFLKDKSSFTRRDLLHFIPFFLSLIVNSFTFFLGSSDISLTVSNIIASKSFMFKEQIGLFSGREVFYIKQGLYLFYFVLIGSMIYKTKIFQRKDWKPIENQWIVFVSVSIFFLQGSRFVIAILTDGNQYGNPIFLTGSGIFSTLLITGILIFLVYNPKVLYGFIFIGNYNLISGRDAAPSGTISTPSVIGPKAINFSVNQLEFFKSAMLAFMSDESPFLDQDFRIAHISEKINIPVHHCSYILNYGFNKNFRDWINAYRIKYFIEQFPLKSDKMTIESMAAEAGFSTTATFYNAFKKEKGVTPTNFFKGIHP